MTKIQDLCEGWDQPGHVTYERLSYVTTPYGNEIGLCPACFANFRNTQDDLDWPEPATDHSKFVMEFTVNLESLHDKYGVAWPIMFRLVLEALGDLFLRKVR